MPAIAGSSANNRQCFVAERIHPGTLGQRMRDQHMQTLDPLGHATAGKRCAQRLDCIALRQVGLVRPPVRRGQLRILLQAVRSSPA